MTYSILGRDPETGELGVAVQSQAFNTGAAVPWARPGVGVVATQSFTDRRYGFRGLELLAAGATPEAALDELRGPDELAGFRQVAFMDATGETAQWTGGDCIPHAGNAAGENWCAQGNMLAADAWIAMGEAFTAATGSLAQRLMAALDAAEAEGGDVRGMQGAGLLVVSGERDDLADTTFVHDLRVDDHPEPLRELRRLLDLRRAFGLSNEAQEVAKAGDGQRAVALFHQALALSDDAQIRWNLALALAIGGQLDAARAELDRLGPHRDAFVETTRRLGPAHLEHGYDAVQQLLA